MPAEDYDICTTCDGSGSVAQGDDIVDCPDCDGDGFK